MEGCGRSERKPQRQLNAAASAGTNGRRIQETRDSPKCRGRREVQIRIAEFRMIEDIKNVSSENQAYALSNSRIFCQGGVDLKQPGPDYEIPARVSPGPLGRSSKRGQGSRN